MPDKVRVGLMQVQVHNGKCQTCYVKPAAHIWIHGRQESAQHKAHKTLEVPVCQSCGEWIMLACSLLAKGKGRPELAQVFPLDADIPKELRPL